MGYSKILSLKIYNQIIANLPKNANEIVGFLKNVRNLDFFLVQKLGKGSKIVESGKNGNLFFCEMPFSDQNLGFKIIPIFSKIGKN